MLFKFIFCCLHPKAFIGQLQNGGMMYEAVDGSGGSHGVFEDTIPLTEDEVTGDHQTSAFVPFGEKGEENFHLFGALLDITNIIQNYDIVAV